MPNYAYRGNAGYISAVEGRLAEAGFVRVGELDIADFALTFCTSMTALEDLYFGDDGLVEEAGAGMVLVDVSACSPSLAGELSAVAAVSDLTMVSAPMVVRNKVASDAFARDNVACFAGSEGDGVDAAMPLLEALFGEVRVVADAGAAQLARAASTIQATAEMVSAIETMSLFKACAASAASGVDVRSLEPVAASPEAEFVLKAIRDESFKGSYTTEMLMSELSAAMMTADDYEMILPQTEAAFHLYELLAVIGGSDMSPAALALVYEGEPDAGDEGAGGVGGAGSGCGCGGGCGCGSGDAAGDGAGGAAGAGGHVHAHGHECGCGHSADAHGLDWSRVKQLYGDDFTDDVMDEFGAYGGFGAGELDGDGDPYDDDDFVSGFGYSIN